MSYIEFGFCFVLGFFFYLWGSWLWMQTVQTVAPCIWLWRWNDQLKSCTLGCSHKEGGSRQEFPSGASTREETLWKKHPVKIWAMTVGLCSIMERTRGLPQPLAMSDSLRFWLLLTVDSVPSKFSWLPLSSSCFGSERGRNQKGMLEMSMRAEDARKPSHQAPTHRASLGVMVILSGW